MKGSDRGKADVEARTFIQSCRLFASFEWISSQWQLVAVDLHDIC